MGVWIGFIERNSDNELELELESTRTKENKKQILTKEGFASSICSSKSSSCSSPVLSIALGSWEDVEHVCSVARAAEVALLLYVVDESGPFMLIKGR